MKARCAFGQSAPFHQFISLITGGVSFALLHVVPSGWFAVALFIVVALSVFWFVIPGHGIIYGPFCWTLVVKEIWTSLFRRQRD